MTGKNTTLRKSFSSPIVNLVSQIIIDYKTQEVLLQSVSLRYLRTTGIFRKGLSTQHPGENSGGRI